MLKKPRIVYVVGAGLSAGLGFPTVSDLLPKMWGRLEKAKLSDDIAAVIRFHHPNFNPRILESYPNIEQLLSEMRANSELFDSSRPATGTFTNQDLEERRRKLLLELASWFHELKSSALKKEPTWLKTLVTAIKSERAKVISFNWDLVLDELLFADKLAPDSYGIEANQRTPCLIKPHGSLNWFEGSSGKHIKNDRKFKLIGKGKEKVFAFSKYRAPKSTKRQYMPLIVPPVFSKQFEGPLFQHLWQETVAALSTASEVRFLGYSLPTADFHARFIIRCGFYNQENGVLSSDKTRAPPTGRANVVIVDPINDGPKRIHDAVGWECKVFNKTLEQWIEDGGLSSNA